MFCDTKNSILRIKSSDLLVSYLKMFYICQQKVKRANFVICLTKVLLYEKELFLGENIIDADRRALQPDGRKG